MLSTLRNYDFETYRLVENFESIYEIPINLLSRTCLVETMKMVSLLHFKNLKIL